MPNVVGVRLHSGRGGLLDAPRTPCSRSVINSVGGGVGRHCHAERFDARKSEHSNRFGSPLAANSSNQSISQSSCRSRKQELMRCRFDRSSRHSRSTARPAEVPRHRHTAQAGYHVPSATASGLTPPSATTVFGSTGRNGFSSAPSFLPTLLTCAKISDGARSRASA